MASKSEIEEIRHQARAELRGEIDRLQDLEVAHRQSAEAVAALSRAMERISIVTMGDDKLGVKGLVADMAETKSINQATLIDKAKTAGMWTGMSVVGVAAGKIAWELITASFAK